MIDELAIEIAGDGGRTLQDMQSIFRCFCEQQATAYGDQIKLREIVRPVVNKLLDEIRQRARAEAERKRLEIADAIMGKLYVSTTFETFNFLDVDSCGGGAKEARAARRYQESVVAAAKDYADNIQSHVANGTNLILRGPSGSGKDHLASSIAKCVSRTLPEGDTICWHGKRERLGFCTGPSLFAAIRQSMNGGRREQDIIEDFTEPQVLILSDPVLTGSSEHTSFQRDVLFRIVDERVTEMRPTIVTINAKDDDAMRTVLGDQIAGRLLDRAIVLECNWPSYRRPAKIVSPSQRQSSGKAGVSA